MPRLRTGVSSAGESHMEAETADLRGFGGTGYRGRPGVITTLKERARTWLGHCDGVEERAGLRDVGKGPHGYSRNAH